MDEVAAGICVVNIIVLWARVTDFQMHVETCGECLQLACRANAARVGTLEENIWYPR